MGQYKIEKLQKAQEMYNDLGLVEAAAQLGIKESTLSRQIREFRTRMGMAVNPFDDKIGRQIREQFTDDELRQILQSSKGALQSNVILNDFKGDVFKLGACTDLHLGSKYSDPNRVAQMFEIFADEQVDAIACAGDITEGLSNRAGHALECTHIGYKNQKEHALKVLSPWKHTPFYFIDGNHDRWYVKSAGAHIVEEMCEAQENFHFLGNDEGDIIVRGAKIRLWHGEDGNSYALSYRLQKIVESLTGGTKPNVLLCGHTHKSVYIFERNIHTVSLGCLQAQSKWMRGKRIAAHTGFYIIEMAIDDKGGIAWFQPRFYPFYV